MRTVQMSTMIALVTVAFTFTACAENQSPPTSAIAPKTAAIASPRKLDTQAGTRILVYNVCADITALTGWKVGATAYIYLDGQEVGTVDACAFKSFPITAGGHKLKIGSGLFNTGLLDFALPITTFPAGKTTYIRALHRQYFEWRVVDEKAGLADIAAIQNINARK